MSWGVGGMRRKTWMCICYMICLFFLMHIPCKFTTIERIFLKSLMFFPSGLSTSGEQKTGDISLNIQCPLLLYQVTWIWDFIMHPADRGHYCRSGTILRVLCKLIHITFSIPLWKKCYVLFIIKKWGIWNQICLILHTENLKCSTVRLNPLYTSIL